MSFELVMILRIHKSIKMLMTSIAIAVIGFFVLFPSGICVKNMFVDGLDCCNSTDITRSINADSCCAQSDGEAKNQDAKDDSLCVSNFLSIHSTPHNHLAADDLVIADVLVPLHETLVKYLYPDATPRPYDSEPTAVSYNSASLLRENCVLRV